MDGGTVLWIRSVAYLSPGLSAHKRGLPLWQITYFTRAT